jgi:TonB family protein
MVVRILLIIYFLLLNKQVFSQVDSSVLPEEEQLISALESMPEYRGGVSKLSEFLRNKIKYPKSAKEDEIKGIVYVKCYVDTTGSTTDHQLIRGIREDLDNEALRVAKLIKFDKPAMQRGKPMKVIYCIPVEFKLSEENEYP